MLRCQFYKDVLPHHSTYFFLKFIPGNFSSTFLHLRVCRYCPETAASAATRLNEAGYRREGRTNTYSNKKSKITIVMKTVSPKPSLPTTRKIDGYYANPDNGTVTVVFEDNSEEVIEWRSFCTFMGFPNMELRENSILLNKTSVKRYCDEKLR